MASIIQIFEFMPRHGGTHAWGLKPTEPESNLSDVLSIEITDLVIAKVLDDLPFLFLHSFCSVCTRTRARGPPLHSLSCLLYSPACGTRCVPFEARRVGNCVSLRPIPPRSAAGAQHARSALPLHIPKRREGQPLWQSELY